jgi:hypothetical protein
MAGVLAPINFRAIVGGESGQHEGANEQRG